MDIGQCNDWNDQPFRCIRYNRRNNPRYLLNSESPSKSGNYINVVNEFSPESDELFKGLLAKISITSLIGAYAKTGHIIPGFL